MDDLVIKWIDPPKDFVRNPKIRRQRPAKRPRQSGIVGPEPDWEVLYSHIQFSELKKLFVASNFSHMEALFPRNGVYRSPKGCIHTSGMDIDHVLAWTSFAHHIGVEFLGRSSYRFPKGTISDFIPKKRFVVERGKKGVNPFKSPLFQRKRSSRELRSEWWHHHRKHESFKEFMQRSSKRTWHLKQCPKKPVNELVLRSLYKIYSVKGQPITPIDPAVNVKARKAYLTDREKKRNAYNSAIEEASSNFNEVVYNMYRVHSDLRRLSLDPSVFAGASGHLKLLKKRFRPLAFSERVRNELRELVAETSRFIFDLDRISMDRTHTSSFNALNDRVQANIGLIATRVSGRVVSVGDDKSILVDGRPIGRWIDENLY